jgi:DNA ligase-associated metallophosphoesterase
MACDDLVFPLLNQTLLLLCQKAIYWQEERTLIAADVHLGKGGHFRKAGIAIPRELAQDDLAVLSDLIRTHQPEQLIFLGDLFHSDMNSDWDWFALWRQQFPALRIVLIRGNHDVIHDDHYSALNIELYQSLLVGPFLMLHHPLAPEELANTEGYVLSGHIHPGVSLKGKGRQSVMLQCFAFGKGQAVLPSFGKFTGKVSMRHGADDKIFGVLHDKVIAL